MAAKAAGRRSRAAETERLAWQANERVRFERTARQEMGWLMSYPQCPFDPQPPWLSDPWVLQETLGEAMVYLSPVYEEFACACHGPPNCCVNRFRTAELLRRDAHIVAKMLADLRDRKSG